MDEKLNQNIEKMSLNTFLKVFTLDGETSYSREEVTYFGLCDITRQMAEELHAIKDSSIFKMCWRDQVEELSRNQPDEEEIYTLDMVYNKIFQSCYSTYKRLYDNLKSGELSLEETDTIFEVYKGQYEDLRKDLHIMCRINPSDNRKWIRDKVHQIQQYQSLHLAVEFSKIIMNIKKTMCLEGDFRVVESLQQMVCVHLLSI